jgi:hypothetical protein
VQRQEDVGKQHHRGEREDGDGEWKHLVIF